MYIKNCTANARLISHWNYDW